MERTVEDQESSLRTDNIDGDRIIPATDWPLWGLAVAGLYFGRMGDTVGIAWYAVGGIAALLALAFTFFFKKVQVLQGGRWETLKRMASPAQAAEIVARLRAASPTS